MKRILSFCWLLLSLPGIVLFTPIQHATAQTMQPSCINIPANPKYLNTGRASDAIAALNNARQKEHLPPVELSNNFYNFTPVQQQIILLNDERVDRGLKPLVLDTILSQAAQSYAQQMVSQHFFSHTSPSGVTFIQRIINIPTVRNHYSTMAENIAANGVAGVGPIYEYMYDDANQGCGHRTNILMPQLTHVGIGELAGSSYGAISVQDFIASAPWNPYQSVPIKVPCPLVASQDI